MGRFQTILKQARFVYSAYTATEMQGFAQVLADFDPGTHSEGAEYLRPGAAPLKSTVRGDSFLAFVRPRPQNGSSQVNT
jgi:hypothetical protein